MRLLTTGLGLGLLLAACALPAVAPDGVPAGAPSLPAEPQLRIEALTHTAKVSDAATDADGRLLVTVSEDKTVRLWSLPDLRPLGVLRPPIADGDKGKLYAAAVSTDGRQVAVGGYNGDIYLFDVASRAIVRRISKPDDAVTSLAFASDGRIAIGYAYGGIQVWQDGEKFADPAYGGEVYGVAFARDGRLAAAAWDGALRLYGPAGGVPSRVTTEAGKKPFRLRFSPDGQRLAIGFDDVVAVEIRDGATLASLPRPSVAGLDGAWMSHVAWSADGRTLFAGGSSSLDVVAWPAAGAGPRVPVGAGIDDSVGALITLPGGQLVLASKSGNIAVSAPPDPRPLYRQRRIGGDLAVSLSASDPTRSLRLASDGQSVEWVTWEAKDRLLRFDVSRLDLRVGEPEAPGLTNWTDQAPGLKAENWRSERAPRLNGQLLTLKQIERAISAAVAHDRLLLGADFTLHMFAPTGAELWNPPLPLPAMAWRVNQSPDGRLAVAALGDSTIRWYRADTGAELLALYVTEDAKRWVAFTPAGYYAASPGGEDLIGWHVNRGPEKAADFFPASRFRDRFYRPDIVASVLATLGAAATPPRLSRDELSPVVAILDPPDGTRVPGDFVWLRYRLRSPSGRPVRAVTALVDGSPPALSMPPELPRLAGPDGEGEGRLAVAIPPGRSVTVSLVAETDNARGEPAQILVTSIAPVRDYSKPRLAGVAVGVADYPRSDMRLKYAGDDAEAIAAAFGEQMRLGAYSDVDVPPLANGAAQRGRILDVLNELHTNSREQGVTVVYFSGHGIQSAGRTFFLPVDADPLRPASTGISMDELRGVFSGMKGDVVVILDMCHAGALQEGIAAADPTTLAAIFQNFSARLTIVVSSGAAQRSFELDAYRHGALTQAILEAMRGAVAGRPGQGGLRQIWASDLDRYLADRMRTLTGGLQRASVVRSTGTPDRPLFAAAGQP